MTTRCAVYGTGSWGTAFAMVLADAGCEVTLWGRRAEVVDAINTTRTNPDYLPGTQLPPAVTATTDPALAARDADFVILAVPSPPKSNSFIIKPCKSEIANWARDIFSPAIVPPNHRLIFQASIMVMTVT